ncbi:hypothetical protein [Mesorhizobium kowhaii]|uniref:hypothetical protein n=1 Tax=Mesorhizobium kowhaii TaxID=1300272 RepID=UPI0011B38C68|nr:hypothetical protein [Mesorhizobium kowhaii]
MTTGFEFLSKRKCKTAPQGITHPADVVGLPELSVEEKRALLASWASDACKVPGIPLLRQWDDGTIATIDDILRALKALDGASEDNGQNRKLTLWGTPYSRRRQRTWSPWPHRRRRDDDDDPPPCPAYGAISPTRGGGGVTACPEPALI